MLSLGLDLEESWQRQARHLLWRWQWWLDYCPFRGQRMMSIIFVVAIGLVLFLN
jgi:hypothetical protein